MLLRTVRAQWLFGRVMASYALQWTLWRLSAKRWFNGRWAAVHQKNATRLAEGFSELRGLFIKLGQVLSVMGGFLPPAYGQALEKLQDAVPPRPFPEMEQRLVEAFGEEYGSNFSSISENPIASASLAQVHEATTKGGQRIALKILYPGIEEVLDTDIKVLRRLMPVVHWIFGLRKPDTVLDQLATLVKHETNYSKEANNLRQLRELLVDTPGLQFPSLVDSLCKRSVLAMSFESGLKINDTSALEKAGIDRTELAKTLVSIYLKMLFEHRVFHADPHPGNFLARTGNELCMLDFGAVETISEELVAGMKQVILGGLSRNSDAVFAGVAAMGFVAEDGDEQLLRNVTHEYLNALSQVNIKNFSRLSTNEAMQISGAEQLRGRLRSIASSLQYPDGYFYVERTLALLFGLVGQLAPEQGLLGLAGPQASKTLLRGYARRAAASETVADAAAKQVEAAIPTQKNFAVADTPSHTHETAEQTPARGGVS